MKRSNITQLFFLIVIALLTSSLAFANFEISTDEGTEFVIKDAPVTVFSNTQSSLGISPENIYIQTVKGVTTIACHFSTQNILITNNNDIPITTTIESNKDFVSFNKYSTFVMPGQTNEILMYVNGPCGKDTKTTQTLTFQTENITHTVKQDITSKHMSNINGAFGNTYASSCPAEQVKYTAVIANPAPFSDTYTVTANSHEKSVTILPNTFTLGPNGQQIVSVFVSFSKEVYGNKTIPITIESSNNNFKSDIELQAEIKQCYDFSLAGPNVIPVCANGFPKESIIEITNNADFSNEFELALKNKPSFVDLPGNYISLRSGETGNINLVAEPNDKTYFGLFKTDVTGLYNTTLVASSVAGDVIAKKDIVYDVHTCYAHEITTAATEFEVCSEDQGIPFSITNNGVYEETYQLALDSSNPEAIFIEEGIVTIAANSSATKTILFNQDNISSSFTASVTAIIANNSKISETVELSFIKKSDSTCYAVTITPRLWEITTTENITEYTIPVTVANKGLRDSNYSISLNDTNNFITINQTHVYLKSEEAKELLLTASVLNTTPKHSAIYITANNNAFSVTKSIFVSINSTFPWWLLVAILLILILLLLLLVTLKGKKSTDKKRKEKVKTISTTKASKKEKRKEKKSKKKGAFPWWILWLLLLLILLLLAVGYFTFDTANQASATNETNSTNTSNETVIIPQTNQTNNTITPFYTQIANWFENVFQGQKNTTTTVIQDNESEKPSSNTTVLKNIQNETQNSTTTVSLCPEVEEIKTFITKNNLSTDPLYQTIPKNSVLEIDLSELFIDPDNDTLTYTITTMDNVSTNVSKNIAKLIPNQDFCGVRTFIITAIDPSGEEAISPTFTLIVEEEENILNMIFTIENLLLLLAILIIITIILLKN